MYYFPRSIFCEAHNVKKSSEKRIESMTVEHMGGKTKLTQERNEYLSILFATKLRNTLRRKQTHYSGNTSIALHLQFTAIDLRFYFATVVLLYEWKLKSLLQEDLLVIQTAVYKVYQRT